MDDHADDGAVSDVGYLYVGGAGRDLHLPCHRLQAEGDLLPSTGHSHATGDRLPADVRLF